MTHSPIRVLLVEDDEDDYVIVLEYLLQIPGHRFEVQWVLGYTDALIEISQNAYDVFIFDYRLGPDNGVELMREVKARGCTVPVIMLTRYSERYIETKARDAGAAGFLLKRDANPATLEAAILRALGRTPAAPPSPAGRPAGEPPHG